MLIIHNISTGITLTVPWLFMNSCYDSFVLILNYVSRMLIIREASASFGTVRDLVLHGKSCF